MSTNEGEIGITTTHTLGPWEDCVGGERSAFCNWQPTDDLAAEIVGNAWTARPPPGDERFTVSDVADSPEAARAAAMAYLRGLAEPKRGVETAEDIAARLAGSYSVNAEGEALILAGVNAGMRAAKASGA